MRTEFTRPLESAYPFATVNISLDHEIQIAERVVKDAVTLFGDLGGFSGFFLAFIGLLIGSIPAKLFDMSKAEALFRANLKHKAP